MRMIMIMRGVSMITIRVMGVVVMRSVRGVCFCAVSMAGIPGSMRMTVFGKLCPISVSVIAVRNVELHLELVRLGNFRRGLQEVTLTPELDIASTAKGEQLARPAGPQRFERHGVLRRRDIFSISIKKIESESRRHSGFEYTDLDITRVDGNKSAAVRPVDKSGGSMVAH